MTPVEEFKTYIPNVDDKSIPECTDAELVQKIKNHTMYMKPQLSGGAWELLHECAKRLTKDDASTK